MKIARFDEQEVHMFGQISKLVELAEHMKLRVFFTNSRHIGAHFPVTGIIHVRSDICPKVQIVVLAHELGHVLSGVEATVKDKYLHSVKGHVTPHLLRVEFAAWDAADKLAKTFGFYDDFYLQLQQVSLNIYTKEIEDSFI